MLGPRLGADQDTERSTSRSQHPRLTFLPRGDHLITTTDQLDIGPVVGQGGMGVVHAARDRGTNRTVALKRVHAGSDWARFAREADVLAKLEHPGIVRYLGHGIDREGPWLAMEWLDGAALADVGGGLSQEQIVAVTLQLAEALAAVHAAGVVHRDVKPSNTIVTLTPAVRARLVDFGLARDLAPSQLTATGTIVGTALYLAPEVLRGQQAGPAADVHALGAMLYELLAGAHPFFAGTAYAVIGRILVEMPDRVPSRFGGMPGDLHALVLATLAKEPQQRPGAAQVASALAQVAARLTSPMTEVAVSIADVHAVFAERRFGATLLARGAGAGQRAKELCRGAERVDRMPDGALLAFFADRSSPDVPVLRAIRSALAIEESSNDCTVVVAASRGSDAAGAHALGATIELTERARSPSASGVFVDGETMALLRGRFLVSRAEDGWQVLGEQSTLAERPVLGALTPTVGRRAELAQLAAVLVAADEDAAPRMALVTAPAGQGKSRLRREILSAFKSMWAGGRSAVIACEPALQDVPWGALGVALRARHAIDRGVDDGRLAALLSRCAVPDHVRGHAQALLGLRDTGDGLRADDGEAQPRAFADAFWSLVSAEAADGVGPVLLIIEDAHWADASTLRLVDTIARTRDLPLALLVFARPETLRNNRELWAGRPFLHLPLSPLSTRASHLLLRSILGDRVDAATAERMVELSDGSPLALEELARAFDAAGSISAITSAQSVFDSRLAALGEEHRLVARAASVLGEVFVVEGVAALLSDAGVDVTSALSELHSLEIVAPRPTCRLPGLHEMEFRHALMRAAAYASIAEEAIAPFHRLAARWRSACADEAAAIAQDAELGGLSDLAARSWMRAGRSASASGDPSAALLHLGRAARHMMARHPDAWDCRLLTESVARAASAHRTRARQLGHLRRMLRDAPTAERRRVLHWREASYWSDRGDLPKAKKLALQVVRDEAPVPQDIREKAYLVAARAIRELDPASAVTDLLSPELVHGATRENRTDLMVLRATALRRLGRVAEAVALLEEATGASGEVEHDAGSAALAAPFAFSLCGGFWLSRAEEVQRRALAWFARTKHTVGLAKGTANLGGIALVGGDLEGAAQILETALDMHVRLDEDRDALADTHALLARVALRTGRLATAEEHLKRARAVVARSWSRYDAVHIALVSASCALEAADVARARREAEEARSQAHGSELLAFEVAALAILARTLEPNEARHVTADAFALFRASDPSEHSVEALHALVLAQPRGSDVGDRLAAKIRIWWSTVEPRLGSAWRQRFEARPEVEEILRRL